MTKRGNIRDTRRATQTLVAHEQRRMFVEQGLLPPTATLADAAQLRKDADRARRAAAQRKVEDDANPIGTLAVGAALVAAALVLAVITGSAVFGWIAAFLGAATFVAWVSDLNGAGKRDERAR